MATHTVFSCSLNPANYFRQDLNYDEASRHSGRNSVSIVQMSLTQNGNFTDLIFVQLKEMAMCHPTLFISLEGIYQYTISALPYFSHLSLPPQQLELTYSATLYHQL